MVSFFFSFQIRVPISCVCAVAEKEAIHHRVTTPSSSNKKSGREEKKMHYITASVGIYMITYL